MGTITTEGRSSRLVKYDRLKMTINFCTRNRSTSKSIKTAMDDCEKFLNIMADMGVKLGAFEAGVNSTVRGPYDEKSEMRTDREVVLRSQYDLNLVNVILHIIEKNDFDANVDFDPEISNENEIKGELYQEAAMTSKKEAEMIANSINMTIVGLDKLETDNARNYYSDSLDTDGSVGDIYVDDLECGAAYAKLSSQQMEIKVTVRGIWKTE